MTKSQIELAAELKTLLAAGPLNTHQIAQARGDRQSYESYLRDRLYRLEAAGLIRSEARKGKGGAVRSRTWALA